eukprot:gnl/TRDRNA2_/TRDRNA2_150825_c0_seq1.p1 gnl/TRDRNA2_/TRDRNA2_150825_c0~~gnl/TRDRNA2_/TRDRNA2_150825_c0_seq1.p1  ORF type:complete len:202 (-),score=20.10 gnl/TRDRNA2_/TRDRNA2_150825_c0_seq1:381-911(-)
MPPSALPIWLLTWFVWHLIYQSVLFSCYATNWDSVLVRHFLYFWFRKRYRKRTYQKAAGEDATKQKAAAEEDDKEQKDKVLVEKLQPLEYDIPRERDEEYERAAGNPHSPAAPAVSTFQEPKASTEKRKVSPKQATLEQVVQKMMPSDADVDSFSLMFFGSVYVVVAGSLLALQKW